MFARAEALDNTYLRTGGGPLALAGGQLWLRQSDRALDPQGVAILHALGVSLRKSQLTARDVSVFRLDGARPAAAAHRGEQAPSSAAANGCCRTRAPSRPTTCRCRSARWTLPTDLTVGRVQESFASPDTLSVWALPGFIALLERSGFSAIRHRLHFQALLALPLLAGTMSLVSAGFSMRPTRRGGVARMIGSGVAAGFALFVVSKVAEEFGQSRRAAGRCWPPGRRRGAGLMLAVALLLHLEDG